MENLAYPLANEQGLLHQLDSWSNKLDIKSLIPYYESFAARVTLKANEIQNGILNQLLEILEEKAKEKSFQYLCFGLARLELDSKVEFNGNGLKFNNYLDQLIYDPEAIQKLCSYILSIALKDHYLNINATIDFVGDL